jgi:uncharacterized protein YdbL (DUF1318 family)
MPLIRTLTWLAGLGLAGLLSGCVPVTVNITFPQEKIEGAAGSIEDMVRSPENAKPPARPPTGPKKEPQSGLAGRWLAALGPREAAAQGRTVDVMPEIRVRTPELMRAIESRRARRPKLAELKARGCIGENNQGLVEGRPGPGCGGEVAALVGAENTDRNFIIDTLMQQNSMPASDAPRVRAAFAKVHRDRAHPGEWVQELNGQWVKK